MRATSQASLAAASGRWEPVLRRAGSGAFAWGEQLYALADLLAGDVSLRRALSDPSRSGDDKAELAGNVLSGKVADEVTELVQGLVRSRWSSSENLAHALEVLAVDSVLASAEAQGRLAAVEEELFRVDRLLASQRELRRALSDQDAGLPRRLAVVDSIFGGKVARETLLFIERATASLRSRSITSALNAILERAAERRRRLSAVVVAAAPLTEAQVSRLGGILERAYGRPVQVNVSVDERVVGGLRIQVGSEVVDATVLSRLDEARRRLAG
jgi:F-type H+-transporting ATPase subunit delta